MWIRKFAVALAGASLAISPVAAQEAAVARQSAPVVEGEELKGVSGTLLAFIVIALGVILWAVLDHADNPDSP